MVSTAGANIFLLAIYHLICLDYNLVGHFAGKLIQDAGLRGYQVGGAQVSEKHCGFIINDGTACAADIKELMEEEIELQKKENEEKQEEVAKIEDSEEIFGELEG